MKAITLLRNNIAHAKTYISSPDEVRQFVDHFTHIRDSIDRVSRRLKAAQ
jgi:hypothetical protein